MLFFLPRLVQLSVVLDDYIHDPRVPRPEARIDDSKPLHQLLEPNRVKIRPEVPSGTLIIACRVVSPALAPSPQTR